MNVPGKESDIILVESLAGISIIRFVGLGDIIAGINDNTEKIKAALPKVGHGCWRIVGRGGRIKGIHSYPISFRFVRSIDFAHEL